MNFIKTYQEFKELPNSLRVHRIKNGVIDSFIVVGTIKQQNGVIIVCEYGDHGFIYVDEDDFEENIWTTDFDAQIAGQIMIQQIKKKADEEIEKIYNIYCKPVEDI